MSASTPTASPIEFRWPLVPASVGKTERNGSPVDIDSARFSRNTCHTDIGRGEFSLPVEFRTMSTNADVNLLVGTCNKQMRREKNPFEFDSRVPMTLSAGWKASSIDSTITTFCRRSFLPSLFFFTVLLQTLGDAKRVPLTKLDCSPPTPACRAIVSHATATFPKRSLNVCIRRSTNEEVLPR